MSTTCPHCGGTKKPGKPMCGDCEALFRSAAAQQASQLTAGAEPLAPIPAVLTDGTTTATVPLQEELLPDDDAEQPNWLDFQAYTMTGFRLFLYCYLLTPVGFLLGCLFWPGCRMRICRDIGRRLVFHAILGTLILAVIYYSFKQTTLVMTANP